MGGSDLLDKKSNAAPINRFDLIHDAFAELVSDDAQLAISQPTFTKIDFSEPVKVEIPVI
jgi:hypothetical protein